MNVIDRQRPIGSGFGAASTAADVLAGIDLNGRTAVVTGGHKGLGLETTRALALAGAEVVVACRDPAAASSSYAGLDRVKAWALDLMDPGSVRRFADRYRRSGRPLHMLINNAGIGGGKHIRDARGYEAQFATNHLGHFQLTNELLPALLAAEGARVVGVSAWGHHLSDIRWHDPHFETEYDERAAYGQSKTAIALFAVELDRRWSGDGIRGYAVHPGHIISTSLGSAMTLDERRAMKMVDENDELVIDPSRDLKTPAQGAATQIFAATTPLLDGIGGVYLADNDIAPVEPDATPIGDGDEPTGAYTNVAGYAVDPESALRLWELSERLI
ncbi:SDR family NAD(P)-dependent oxidoreductase [Nocardia harenae]|uniref:SDR family NAD(P)-dependent oxidoreductase n=1 Tax=Nocardia harenae TaxID=358707 RepID=UPI00082FCBEC|nr:SDR family NAD(P)-dependent oxidoreductase [Nocardia harenae]